MKKPKISGGFTATATTSQPPPPPLNDALTTYSPPQQPPLEEDERENTLTDQQQQPQYGGEGEGEMDEVGEDDSEEDGEDEDYDDDDEYEDYEGEYEDEEVEEEVDGDGEVDGTVAAERMASERKKLADDFFEVEFIRRKRVCKGERQYLIKWRGWPESANTWEPVDHLQTCPDVVEAFEESLRSGQKKISRKRKRKFTQPKKKMQYSYGSSKKHDEMVKRPRASKIIDGKGSERVSPCIVSNELENGNPVHDQKPSGKKLDLRLPQPLTVDGDGLVNCQSNANCVEGDQSNLRRGAKRRKSGSVRRFAPDMTSFSFDYYANSALNISSCDRVDEVMVGNSDGYRKKFDSSRSSTVVTKLIKPIRYSASVTNNVQDVSVTFVAMRADGKEVLVDNKFLRANNPLLLIDYYEQHLRYNPN